MKPEQKSLRIGAAVILLALMFRFLSNGFSPSASSQVAAALLYAGTGRVFTTIQPVTPTQPPEPSEPSEPAVTEPILTEPAQQIFSSEDAVLVSITNHPGLDYDLDAMLRQPLTWDLTTQEPAILIIHSHASESYQNTEGYQSSDDYRTMDPRYNMISIGAHLAECLQKQGLSVIHDTNIHDSPSYNDAYPQSRKTVEAYLAQYPSIQLVLDIHRDAYTDNTGSQAQNVITIDGKRTSRLMLVAGTNASGQEHPNWQTNMAMAVKLQAVLEKQYPGLCRNLTMRSSVFNQDLSPGSLLIEVGTAGDTRQDALTAAEFLAEGIALLSRGSCTELMS